MQVKVGEDDGWIDGWYYSWLFIPKIKQVSHCGIAGIVL